LAAQTWPKQLPVQQSLFCWQASPVSAHPNFGAQTPLSHWLVQHWRFFLHGWPLSVQPLPGLWQCRCWGMQRPWQRFFPGGQEPRWSA
jgi:hypothetical protein